MNSKSSFSGSEKLNRNFESVDRRENFAVLLVISNSDLETILADKEDKKTLKGMLLQPDRGFLFNYDRWFEDKIKLNEIMSSIVVGRFGYSNSICNPRNETEPNSLLIWRCSNMTSIDPWRKIPTLRLQLSWSIVASASELTLLKRNFYR